MDYRATEQGGLGRGIGDWRDDGRGGGGGGERARRGSRCGSCNISNSLEESCCARGGGGSPGGGGGSGGEMGLSHDRTRDAHGGEFSRRRIGTDAAIIERSRSHVLRFISRLTPGTIALGLFPRRGFSPFCGSHLLILRWSPFLGGSRLFSCGR